MTTGILTLSGFLGTTVLGTGTDFLTTVFCLEAGLSGALTVGVSVFGTFGEAESGVFVALVSSVVFFFKSRNSSMSNESWSFFRSLSPKNFSSSSDKGLSAEISVSATEPSGGRCMLMPVVIPK